MIDANRHPRMKDIYCEFFDLWYSTTEGGLLNSFYLLTRYDYGGMWGLLEHMDQDTSTAPKWMAHVDCVFEKPKSTFYEEFDTKEFVISYFVNGEVLYVQSNYDFIRVYNVFDIQGRFIHSSESRLVIGQNELRFPNLMNGVYIVEIGSYRQKVVHYR